MDIDLEPEVAQVNQAKPLAELAVVKEDLKPADFLSGELILTPEQSKKAHELAETLNLRDTNAVMTFGVSAQAKLSQTAERLIGHTKTKDIGEPAGKALTNLVGVVRGFDAKQFGGASTPIGWLVEKFVDPANKLVARFERSAGQIDGIVTTLQQERAVLEQDVQSLDNLFLDSVDQYRDLTVYVVAGKLRAQKEREELELEKKEEKDLDPLKIQERKEKEERVELLERKVNDLELTRTVTLQTLPQIRMVQEVDKMLLQKIDSSIITTIPIWKTQVALAVTAYRQKKAIELQKSLTDATNELLKENAALVKDNVVSGKKELERGVVDVSTLEEVSATLLSAVTESLEISKEARARREQTSEQLEVLEGNLVRSLAGAGAETPKLK